MMLMTQQTKETNQNAATLKRNSKGKGQLLDLPQTIGHPRKELEKSVEQLMKWVTAGENEIYLRQMIDATLTETQTGYSIPHFDFLIYFKHKNVRENQSEEPLKYLRKLILTEFLVKVKANMKYQNFHRRHEAMIKLWQQMVRVISFESTMNGGMEEEEENKEEEDMFNTSDDDEERAAERTPTKGKIMGRFASVREAITFFRKQRIQMIRSYMLYCQNHQQSKTQQCSDLYNIFCALWNMEEAQEKIDGTTFENLSMAAFTELWSTRYNTQNRIVINASDEQLEARAMFCHSANALLQYFNYFNKSPLSNRSIASLAAQLKHFIATNNNANNYNVNVQLLQNPFTTSRFEFTKQDFLTDMLPTLRTCCAALSRVSSLQGNIYLSLYESFWDVSFVVAYYHVMVCMLAANNFEVAEATSSPTTMTPLTERQQQKTNKHHQTTKKKVRKIPTTEPKSKKLLKRIKRFIQD